MEHSKVSTMSEYENLLPEMAELLVSALHLDIAPSDIVPEAMLFGPEGLGLDSIDALEIAYAIYDKYGLQIESDNSENEKIFASLKNLTTFVSENRA